MKKEEKTEKPDFDINISMFPDYDPNKNFIEYLKTSPYVDVYEPEEPKKKRRTKKASTPKVKTDTSKVKTDTSKVKKPRKKKENENK